MHDMQNCFAVKSGHKFVLYHSSNVNTFCHFYRVVCVRSHKSGSGFRTDNNFIT